MDRIFAAGPWVTESDINIVLDALRNGWYEHPFHYCEKFQAEFAAYHGRKYGIMTPNCTTAIHLLLTALGVQDGDEVIVPECTWIGSCAGVSYLRANPIFADIDPVSWCLDPESVRARLSPKTRAIIAVDLYGNMPDMPALQKIADERGIPLIEDAAEGVGSTLHGKRAGSFGVASVFSFHRTKTITTGEGGMLLLDDEKLYQRCMFLRDHGRRVDGKLYYNYEITYKYMPFNVQAALGYAQFKRVDELVARKRHHLNTYRAGLAGIADLALNPEPEGGVNGAWITGLLFGRSHGIDKDKAIAHFTAKGIPGRPFFYPLSSLPAYPGLREKYEPLNPVAYEVSERGVNLPGALNLTDDQLQFIIDAVKELVAGGK
ncbi:MAG: DegT/DnrJ/EryC1/StrS family aminotransferase [Leptospirales bacterium]|nr:DegT/DnrJ/EryC1/StrS family aminotransferase [Leptospirales bacterium]